jgi:cobalt/nickel transport system permease protein
MTRIDAGIGDLDTLDRLAAQDSPIHRLDPRAKVIATAFFLLTVVSFGKYDIAGLTPLFLYPAVLLTVGLVPLRVVLRYLLIACPFALLVGVFNPLIDRAIVVHWGGIGISGGWLSFGSILLRFLLTASAVLLLLACTGYVSVCAALGRLGAPHLLTMQFLMLYRFIFILTAEASRMVRAHSLRSVGPARTTIRVWASLAGHLLLRAYDRGQRVHAAMLARGFDGTPRSLRASRWSLADTAFVLGCGLFLAFVRFGHPVDRLGSWFLGVFR